MAPERIICLSLGSGALVAGAVPAYLCQGTDMGKRIEAVATAMLHGWHYAGEVAGVWTLVRYAGPLKYRITVGADGAVRSWGPVPFGWDHV